ncbi:MAG: hypothetical protein AAGG44_02790 [Planctomycetota bacterium]
MAIEDELGSRHRYELQDRYLELTRAELPTLALQRGWEIKEDHCFMRIILDRLFHGCWYHHLDVRLTAYKQLNEAQLRTCISLAEELMNGDAETLSSWNRDSLRWRGRLK